MEYSVSWTKKKSYKTKQAQVYSTSVQSDYYNKYKYNINCTLSLYRVILIIHYITQFILIQIKQMSCAMQFWKINFVTVFRN